MGDNIELVDYDKSNEPSDYIKTDVKLLKAPWNSILDCEAVIIYGQLLRLCTVSEKNGWIDKNNKIYVKFSVDEMADFLGVSRKTASKYKKQLLTAKLIEIPGEENIKKANHSFPIYVKQIKYGEIKNFNTSKTKRKTDSNKFNNFQQNDYDMEELENSIVDNLGN